MLAVDTSTLTTGWFKSLSFPVQSLLQDSLRLVDMYAHQKEGMEEIYDYGFLVFLPAKAYEAYLKDFFYQMEFISVRSYQSDHFRIGKALNPDLPKKYRDHEWLYDELSDRCGHSHTRNMWRTWKRARNRVFHFDPKDPDGVSFEAALALVSMVFETIEQCSKCEVTFKKD